MQMALAVLQLRLVTPRGVNNREMATATVRLLSRQYSLTGDRLTGVGLGVPVGGPYTGHRMRTVPGGIAVRTGRVRMRRSGLALAGPDTLAIGLLDSLVVSALVQSMSIPSRVTPGWMTLGQLGLVQADSFRHHPVQLVQVGPLTEQLMTAIQQLSQRVATFEQAGRSVPPPAPPREC